MRWVASCSGKKVRMKLWEIAGSVKCDIKIMFYNLDQRFSFSHSRLSQCLLLFTRFWHFNLRVIGARSGSQSVRDTLCFIFQTSGPSPRLNLLAMKPNQRVIYKSLQSQLKCRDWDYGRGERRRVSRQLLTSDDCNNLTCVSNHQSGSSSLLSLGSSEMSGDWATSIDCILTNELGWMNKSFRLLIRGMCSGVTFNLLDKYFQQQGNH